MKKGKSIYRMGTKIDLTIIHPKAETVMDEVIQLLTTYEKRFSANDPTSELSQINQHAGIRPIKVHPELYELIKIGKKHSLAPSSYLNIAIGPLVQSWRIGFHDAQKPSDAKIQNVLRIIDPDQVLLLDDSVYLKSKDMAIDLGALAKGYIADRIIDYLVSVNTESALINLGGNLITMGPAKQHADNYWRIGIQNPVHTRGNSQIILKVRDQSVVTSGVYERQLVENGQSYHHIFNPRTGYPVETELASVTIISDRSIDGEIWTTRLFGQSVYAMLSALNKLSEIEGILITNKGKVYYSDGVSELLV